MPRGLKICLLVLLVVSGLCVYFENRPMESQRVKQSVSSGSVLTGYMTPAPKVQKEITYNCDQGFYVIAKLKQEFIDKYQYEDAKNYCFAMKIYENDVDIGYFKTYRNKNGGVSNDLKKDMDGCIPGAVLKKGYVYEIYYDKEYKFANPKGSYGYNTRTITKGNAYGLKTSGTKEIQDAVEYTYHTFAICKES